MSSINPSNQPEQMATFEWKTQSRFDFQRSDSKDLSLKWAFE